MKILLIRPWDREDINTRLPESINKAKGIIPPLGLAYIASFLRQNKINVSILDAEALNLTFKDLKNIFEKDKPDLIGITCMTSTFQNSLNVAKLAKKFNAKVVLGGPHISAFPKESVSFNFIDFAICGDGEESFFRLIKELEKKNKRFNFKRIPGLIYKEKGNIIQNGFAVVHDLDKLPFPALDILPMHKYFSVMNDSPFITIMSSRGCPYQCGFCFKQPVDRFIRMRSPKNVVDEIEHWISLFKIKEVMFYDDTLTLKRDHIEGICDEIIKRDIKIKWEGPTRVDCIDEKLLIKMKKAGCNKLRYGVESGDPGILKLMRKGTDLELIKKVFRLSRKVGIKTFAYFIIGYYSETPETMKNTINFAISLDPDWAMYTIATPYPKTHLFELASKAGIIEDDYWLKVAKGESAGRMPYLVKDAEKWAKKAYFQFYFRPIIIFRRIKDLNSLNTFKKYFSGALSILKI